MLLLTVTNIVTLSPVSRLPAPVLGRIKSTLSFQNPAWLEAEKRGFYSGNIAQEIRGYQVDGDQLIIPRGVTRQLIEMLMGAAVQYRIEDRLPRRSRRRRGQKMGDLSWLSEFFKGDGGKHSD